VRVAPGTWNAERVIEALRAWTVREGRAPRAFEWSPTLGRAVGLLSERPCRWEIEYPRWPSFMTVRRYHGDWHAALAAAGLTAPRPARMALEDRVAAARRLAAERHRVAMIAEILAVHPGTVRGYLTAGACPFCGRVKVRAESRSCRACRPRPAAWSAFSDDELLERIQAWTVRFGAPPSKRQWRRVGLGGHPAWEAEHPAWPSPGALAQRFGSWSAALSAAGVARPPWTAPEMLVALRRFAARCGRAPTAREWPRLCADHPSAAMVSAAFGSWHAGLRAAGLAPRRPGRWTDPDICAALRRLAAELGRTPHRSDLHAGDCVPGHTTVRRHYGTLENALRAAGLQPAADAREHRPARAARPARTRGRRTPPGSSRAKAKAV